MNEAATCREYVLPKLAAAASIHVAHTLCLCAASDSPLAQNLEMVAGRIAFSMAMQNE